MQVLPNKSKYDKEKKDHQKKRRRTAFMDMEIGSDRVRSAQAVWQHSEGCLCASHSPSGTKEDKRDEATQLIISEEMTGGKKRQTE